MVELKNQELRENEEILLDLTEGLKYLLRSPYPVSNIYGLGKYIKKYGFYPNRLPLCVYTDHGVALSETIPPHELDNDAPYMLKHSPYLVKVFRNISKKPCFTMFSPFVFYRRKNKIIQSEDAEGTIIFPAHSTPEIDDLTDWEKYIGELNMLPPYFKPLTICLHATDIRKGIHKYFLQNGFKVKTAGNPCDTRFTERFYDILRHHKRALSNLMGSYGFYAVEMGIPFSLYGEGPHYYNHTDLNIESGHYISYLKSKRYQCAVNLFTGFQERVTVKQKKFVEYELGLTEGTGRLKLSYVLYKSFILYFRKHPYQTISQYLIPSALKKILIKGGAKSLINTLKYRFNKIKRPGEIEKNCFASLGISKREFTRIKKLPSVTSSDTIILDKKITFTDGFWFLHSLREIFNDGTYKFISNIQCPYIIDCGANIGLSIIYFKRLYPQAKVLAFEPDPEIYKLLCKNIRQFQFSNVKLLDKAVWNCNTRLIFDADGALGGRIIDEEVLTKGKVQIQTVRLKEFLKERVDFLKIDIEGAEYEVLLDCNEFLKNVEFLFVEYHSPAKKYEQHLHEILQIIANAGFRYYIKEAWENLPFPFIDRKKEWYDLQLNIFCYRTSEMVNTL